jgi:hypothetical protein
MNDLELARIESSRYVLTRSSSLFSCFIPTVDRLESRQKPTNPWVINLLLCLVVGGCNPNVSDNANLSHKPESNYKQHRPEVLAYPPDAELEC